MAAIISQTTPKDIFDKYTKQFPLPGVDSFDGLSELAKGFRRKNEGLFFKSKYDEPTYLTFRVAFDFDCADDYAIAAVANGNLKYDEIPHPFLNIILNDAHSSDPSKSSHKTVRDLEFLRQSGISTEANTINGEYASIVNRDNLNAKNSLDIYSAYNYLKYNLGEDFRALYLLMFKTMLYDISVNYPFAFTSIEGIGNLFKVDSKTGVRLNPENSIITINCNESLDLRITQLQDWYKQIVWDSVYQRWLLPDMMRYFKMKIFISELRLFHKAENMPSIENGGKTTIQMVSHDINEIIPTICLECRQCEFVMDEAMQHMSTFHSSSNGNGGAQTQPKIKIRVGNVIQRSSYGLNKVNKYSIVDDRYLARFRSYEDADEYGGFDFNGLPDADAETLSDSLYRYSAPNAISKTLSRLGVDFSNYTNGTYDTSRTLEKSLMTRMVDLVRKAGEGEDVVEEVEKVLSEPIGRMTVRTAISTAIENGKNTSNGLGFLTGLLNAAISAIPEIIEMSVATNHDYCDHLVRQIVGNIPLSQATDINNTIAQVYQSWQKGLSSEATTDSDNGYVEPNMEHADYKSTANETPFTTQLPPDNKGLSNEAVDDTDNGYVDPNMIHSPYVSTANELPFDATLPPENKGLSNEAVEDTDHGWSEPNLEQPPYESTANELPFDATLPPENKGLSNEAIEDKDHGYSEPNLEQPPYESTANELPFDATLPPENKGLSNEAIEDKDHGYSEPNMEKAPYRSTAYEEGRQYRIPPREREIHSEANEDLDHGYSEPNIQHASYKSTATSGHITLVPKRPDYKSTATENNG